MEPHYRGHEEQVLICRNHVFFEKKKVTKNKPETERENSWAGVFLIS